MVSLSVFNVPCDVVFAGNFVYGFKIITMIGSIGPQPTMSVYSVMQYRNAKCVQKVPGGRLNCAPTERHVSVTLPEHVVFFFFFCGFSIVSPLFSSNRWFFFPVKYVIRARRF